MSKLFLAGSLCAATLLPTVTYAYDLTIRRDSSPATAALQSGPSAPDALPAPTEPNVRPAAPSAESRRAKSVDIDLTVNGNGFRLGGRLSGDKGVSGAWVGAQVREDGLTLDGQLQSNEGQSRDFRLNLGLPPGWARKAARMWLMLQ